MNTLLDNLNRVLICLILSLILQETNLKGVEISDCQELFVQLDWPHRGYLGAGQAGERPSAVKRCLPMAANGCQILRLLCSDTFATRTTLSNAEYFFTALAVGSGRHSSQLTITI